MRSEWSLKIDGQRCVAKRSLRSTFGGYAVLLAATIIWYPLTGVLVSLLPDTPTGFTMGVIMAIPIVGLVLWVPRLANERRTIAMRIDGDYFSVFDARFLRSRILEVVILPHRSLGGLVRHRVFITFATGDLQNMVLVATEREIEAARGHADDLARWLGVKISAATSPPPRAIVLAK